MSLADGTCGTGGWTGPLPGDPDNNSILTATAVYGGVQVSWTYPTINPEAVAYVELYRGINLNFAEAPLHRIVAGDTYFDAYPDNTEVTYFYWIRIVSVYGTQGDPIGPATATAGAIATQMLGLLEGALSESALTTALQAKIANITAVENSLLTEITNRLGGDAALADAMTITQTEVGTLSTLILTEQSERIAADTATVTSINAVAAAVNSPTTGLDTKASIAYVDQAEADAISASATASMELAASLGGQNIYIGTSPLTAPAGTQFVLGQELKSVAEGNPADLLPGEQLTISGNIWQDAASLAAGQHASLYLWAADSGGTWMVQVALTSAATTPEYKTATITLPVAANMVDVKVALYHLGGTGTYAGEVYADRIQVERGPIATAYKAPSVVDLTAVNAAIQSEATTRASADSALASDITTLQTTVGGHTTSIQTNATSIDGLEAQYTVKVDNNGYVSGFGLASTPVDGTPFSEFTVVADKFSIAPVASDPAAADGSPFFHLTVPTVIGGVTVPAGTYMKAAHIHDASITTAKIADAQITNAKIANLDAAKIDAGTITTGKIQVGAVSSASSQSQADLVVYPANGDSFATIVSNPMNFVSSGGAGTYAMLNAEIDVLAYAANIVGANGIEVVAQLFIDDIFITNSSATFPISAAAAGTCQGGKTHISLNYKVSGLAAGTHPVLLKLMFYPRDGRCGKTFVTGNYCLGSYIMNIFENKV